MPSHEQPASHEYTKYSFWNKVDIGSHWIDIQYAHTLKHEEQEQFHRLLCVNPHCVLPDVLSMHSTESEVVQGSGQEVESDYTPKEVDVSPEVVRLEGALLRLDLKHFSFLTKKLTDIAEIESLGKGLEDFRIIAGSIRNNSNSALIRDLAEAQALLQSADGQKKIYEQCQNIFCLLGGVVSSYGGSILSLEGDALVACFLPNTSIDNPQEAANDAYRRAVTAQVEIQKAIQDVQNEQFQIDEQYRIEARTAVIALNKDDNTQLVLTPDIPDSQVANPRILIGTGFQRVEELESRGEVGKCAVNPDEFHTAFPGASVSVDKRGLIDPTNQTIPTERQEKRTVSIAPEQVKQLLQKYGAHLKERRDLHNEEVAMTYFVIEGLQEQHIVELMKTFATNYAETGLRILKAGTSSTTGGVTFIAVHDGICPGDIHTSERYDVDPRVMTMVAMNGVIEFCQNNNLHFTGATDYGQAIMADMNVNGTVFPDAYSRYLVQAARMEAAARGMSDYAIEEFIKEWLHKTDYEALTPDNVEHFINWFRTIAGNDLVQRDIDTLFNTLASKRICPDDEFLTRLRTQLYRDLERSYIQLQAPSSCLYVVPVDIFEKGIQPRILHHLKGVGSVGVIENPLTPADAGDVCDNRVQLQQKYTSLKERFPTPEQAPSLMAIVAQLSVGGRFSFSIQVFEKIAESCGYDSGTISLFISDFESVDLSIQAGQGVVLNNALWQYIDQNTFTEHRNYVADLYVSATSDVPVKTHTDRQLKVLQYQQLDKLHEVEADVQALIEDAVSRNEWNVVRYYAWLLPDSLTKYYWLTLATAQHGEYQKAVDAYARYATHFQQDRSLDMYRQYYGRIVGLESLFRSGGENSTRNQEVALAQLRDLRGRVDYWRDYMIHSEMEDSDIRVVEGLSIHIATVVADLEDDLGNRCSELEEIGQIYAKLKSTIPEYFQKDPREVRQIAEAALKHLAITEKDGYTDIFMYLVNTGLIQSVQTDVQITSLEDLLPSKVDVGKIIEQLLLRWEGGEVNGYLLDDILREDIVIDPRIEHMVAKLISNYLGDIDYARTDESETFEAMFPGLTQERELAFQLLEFAMVFDRSQHIPETARIMTNTSYALFKESLSLSDITNMDPYRKAANLLVQESVLLYERVLGTSHTKYHNDALVNSALILLLDGSNKDGFSYLARGISQLADEDEDFHGRLCELRSDLKELNSIHSTSNIPQYIQVLDCYETELKSRNSYAKTNLKRALAGINSDEPPLLERTVGEEINS